MMNWRCLKNDQAVPILLIVDEMTEMPFMPTEHDNNKKKEHGESFRILSQNSDEVGTDYMQLIKAPKFGVDKSKQQTDGKFWMSETKLNNWDILKILDIYDRQNDETTENSFIQAVN